MTTKITKAARVAKTPKIADSKGRVALGRQFAGRMMIVDDTNPNVITITPAVAIPECEAWLYRNEQALASVRKGLEQAKKGQVSSTPPDLEADEKLIAELEG